MNLNTVEYYYVRNLQGDIIRLIDKVGIQEYRKHNVNYADNSKTNKVSKNTSNKSKSYEDAKTKGVLTSGHTGQETYVFPHFHTWDWSLPKPRLDREPWTPK